MGTKAADIVDAIEVFVRGYAFHRCRTHPYLVERIGPLWWMHDGPRRSDRGYRRDEWVAYSVAPREVDATARRHSRGHFCLSVIRGVNDADEDVRTEYKGLSYRLMATEPLFVHSLQRIPKLAAPAEITRLRTPELAEKFAKTTRMKVLTPAQLADDAPQRQYVAVDGKKIVGWVCSVEAGDSRWCTNMVVRPTHRRRGIGKALLAKMLRDDRTHGARQSVLLASHAGALLYPHVGYQQVGLLLMFVPKRRGA